ncbi:MAG: serine hydrolase [Candidatus Eremiobacteraeota bacterium]|nr:serine hydrolase [Candidatus Eremiobacteraeota bacterium]
MRGVLPAFAAALFFAFASVGATADTAAEAQAVNDVLTKSPVPADRFDAAFLAQVPAAQLTPIRDQVVAPLGQFVRLGGSNGKYTAFYTKGHLTVYITLDADGKISGLLLRDPVVTGGSLEEALKPFADLPGSVSYVVLQDGREIAARNQAQALGVGSTFKLAVLNALRAQIDAGKRRWTDVVALQHGWKSLPSGVLQAWPDGAPLTLHTLATEMISISDNTAADALVHLVGRAAIAPYAGRNDPFMTTHDMFVLKSRKNAALLGRYRTGDLAARRDAVSRADALPLPAIEDLDESPALSDVEWHYTNRELCKLMAGVHDLDVTRVNPGPAAPSQWKRISYKGGSDFGVISMTTWVQAKDGRSYCMSASWNNAAAPIDDLKFETLFSTALGTLAGRK